MPAQWGLEGWPENESPFGLLFFNPTSFKKGIRAWLKALLSKPNPYTGIPLAKDPALAIIQLQNEDSLLFWTAQSIKGKQAELLGRQFGEWLKAKYGSLAAAFAAWGNEKVPEDRPGAGSRRTASGVGVDAGARGRPKRRLDDQLRVLCRGRCTRFNRECERYLREELGCKQLINAGNWRTADAAKLDDAERWSYTANEVIAVNRYYSPVHIGPDRGWRINPGDTFEDASVLLRPLELPLNLRQAKGHPMMVSESHWVPPLGYQSEGPFLVAAYQSLTGCGCVLLVWNGRGRVVEPGSSALGQRFAGKMGRREPDGAGPVSGGGAALSQAVPEGRGAGYSGGPDTRGDLEAGAAGAG